MPKLNYNVRLSDELVKAIETRAYINGVGFTTQMRLDLENLYGVKSEDGRKAA